MIKREIKREGEGSRESSRESSRGIKREIKRERSRGRSREIEGWKEENLQEIENREFEVLADDCGMLKNVFRVDAVQPESHTLEFLVFGF